MRKKQPRIIAILLLFVLLGMTSINIHAEEAEPEKNAKAIYVVFDNSGSMYGPGNMAWSQATYAMEVFAAMLNFENGDIMKVFPMHDVTTDGSTGGRSQSSIMITSRDDILQIHNMYTPKPLGTPYTQVNNAAAELQDIVNSGEAAEGWLLVLTDGDFDADIPNAGLREDLISKAEAHENIYVQYLAMGSEIEVIPTAEESVGFYAQKAESSAEVLNELSVISNRIFKRNEYTDYVAGEKLNFDIPLGKVIVFAQGENVQVNSLKNKEGGEVTIQERYEVSYSSTDGAGLTSYVTETPTKDTSLKGVVTIFSNGSSIKEGEYALDISGAEQVKVYYEPDVEFGVGLFENGVQVLDDTIKGGSYELKVGFVNRLTREFIGTSKLLGVPNYELYINGEACEVPASDELVRVLPLDVEGDTLTVEAGVTYLDDYTDSDSMAFTVCTLEMTVSGPQVVQLKSLEDTANGIEVTVTRNGVPLSEEQWDAAQITVACLDEEGKPFAMEFDVVKGSEVSTWIVLPKYQDDDMYKTDTGIAEIKVSSAVNIDGYDYGKTLSQITDVQDDRNILDYLKKYYKEIIISILLFILLLGYVPPFKKRFSPKMKKRPSIECTAERIGVHDMLVKGSFQKNLASVLLPYTPEVGKLTFTPGPVRKTLKLRATGGGSMVILNTSAYAGKEEFTFTGQSIPENYKGLYRISGSTILAMSTPEFTYTCIPSVQRR